MSTTAALRPRNESEGWELLRKKVGTEHMTLLSQGLPGWHLLRARRSLWQSIQAVRYEPRPSCFMTCRAEIPLEWEAMR